MPYDLKQLYESVISRYKPEPPTLREKASMHLLDDPAELSVFFNRLELIAVEGRELFTKMGAAPLITSGDLVTGVNTAQGDMAICSTGTYLHAASTQFPAKFILERYSKDPTVGIKDGDIWFVNEALYGAT